VIASALWREGHIRGPGRLKSSYGILGPYEGHKAEFELPGGSAAAGAGWRVGPSACCDLQPISKFHTKYYLWQLMRRARDPSSHANIEETLNRASNTSCTDAARHR
jgi:hypothetical protein